ncbi:MAG TPA: acetyl-CoA carboxylase biotin carboxyl carrier protein [Beijerinckiaceae bacterium]|nr:acetyl-CoA carboxylase biotin carboxyl carrier protein [Beijerinckiaceae bacterium]
MKTPARRPKPVERPKSAKAPAIDPALVEALAAIAASHGLSEVEVEHEGLRIRVARQSLAQPNAPLVIQSPAPIVAAPVSIAPAAALAPEDHPGVVKSPMVGTAYLRPSPEAKAFVEVGSSVKAGDKILLVEAMKTFNEIIAPRTGSVTAILVEDGQPVEYGEPLLVIE